MKKHAFIPALALSGLFLSWTACTAPPAPAEAPATDLGVLTTEIQALEDAYATGSVNKDADAIVAYYTDDAVTYVHQNAPVVGKEAIRQRLADRIAKDTLGLVPTFKVLELYVGKDHVTEIGSWTDADANGEVKDQGTYISIFRKEGDKWLCIRDMSVSATPKVAAGDAVAAQ